MVEIVQFVYILKINFQCSQSLTQPDRGVSSQFRFELIFKALEQQPDILISIFLMLLILVLLNEGFSPRPFLRVALDLDCRTTAIGNLVFIVFRDAEIPYVQHVQGGIRLVLHKNYFSNIRVRQYNMEAILKENIPKQQLKQQLIAMEFPESLVDAACNNAQTLDQAVEFIIKALQTQERGHSRLICLVRIDLNMSLGKIAAQAAHAVLKAYKQVKSNIQNENQSSEAFLQWMQTGQQIDSYQVESMQQLMGTLQKSALKGINWCSICDAGRTQVIPGTITVGAIGPIFEADAASLIDKLQPL